MTVFLLILKIIGIVLASIVGLAVLMAILLLCVPFSYKLKLNGKNEQIAARFSATWCFGIIYSGGSYSDRKISYAVRVFGIKIISGDDTRSVSDRWKSSMKKTAEKKKTGDKKNKESKITFAGRVKKIAGTLKTVWEKIKTAKYIIGAPVTQRAWEYAKMQFLKILKSSLPRKMQGRLEFGTGDPATTAIVYGAASAIVNSIDDRLMLVPNMEEKVVDADFSINGRIFAGYVLICVLKVIRNRNVRRVISYTRRNL